SRNLPVEALVERVCPSGAERSIKDGVEARSEQRIVDDEPASVLEYFLERYSTTGPLHEDRRDRNLCAADRGQLAQGKVVLPPACRAALHLNPLRTVGEVEMLLSVPAPRRHHCARIPREADKHKLGPYPLNGFRRRRIERLKQLDERGN